MGQIQRVLQHRRGQAAGPRQPAGHPGQPRLRGAVQLLDEGELPAAHHGRHRERHQPPDGQGQGRVRERRVQGGQERGVAAVRGRAHRVPHREGRRAVVRGREECAGGRHHVSGAGDAVRLRVGGRSQAVRGHGRQKVFIRKVKGRKEQFSPGSQDLLSGS